MIKKLLCLLVLLMTVATNTWAESYRLYLDVSGTSATLKYGSDYDGKPNYNSGSWSTDDVKTTVQTITTDATSCAIFSGTAINSLFSGFTALTSADLRGLNTANVTVMYNLFGGCKALTSVDLSGWNTSKATNMNTLFDGCENLTSVDLSSWDTSSATSMGSMFNGCKALTSVNLSSFNTSNVEIMGGMFSGCKALTTLDLSNFNTSKVTAMSDMFSGCSALTSVNLSSFNTSNVNDMSGMFNSCSSLTTVDLSSFNTSKVTNMNTMFYFCTNLATIYVGNNWSTDAVTKSVNMFGFCIKLTNLNGNHATDKTNAHTGEGGYLSTKPYKVTLNDTKDAANWTITPAEATTTGVSKGKTVTLTYSGRLKVKTVTATTDAQPARALSAAIADDIGKIAGQDGKIYNTKNDATDAGTTPVAMIAYVGTASDCSHGLAIALEDVSNELLSWDNSGSHNDSKTAAEWCSAWNTSKAVTGGTWRLPSISDWQYMFIGCGASGSYSDNPSSMSYSELATKLSTAQGTALLVNTYWSSTEQNSDVAWYYYLTGPGGFNANWKTDTMYIRACLEF